MLTSYSKFSNVTFTGREVYLGVEISMVAIGEKSCTLLFFGASAII
jgi:hypothetical protein